jgi:hypothetical protein
LPVIVELGPGESDSAQRRCAVAVAVWTELIRLNSEFAHYALAAAQTQVVRPRPAGDPEYFPPGVKHRPARPSTRLCDAVALAPIGCQGHSEFGSSAQMSWPRISPAGWLVVCTFT